MSVMGIDASCGILTGSVTPCKIDVNGVAVENFKAGFDEGPEHYDFKEISFD